MSIPFAESFKGKKVLITGHTGFKGSWLAIWLHRLGARVSGYALAPDTEPSNFVASDVRSLLEHHIEGDVRDAARFEQALLEIKPDVVFHLAAQALVRVGYETPRETFDVNVMGTVNVLDALRRLGSPCVCVVVTSDKCYENREQVWGYRETDAMGGYDPYSASKGCAELVVSSMRRSYFSPHDLAHHRVKVASARAGNVIGGGDWARDRIVTDLVKSIVDGRPVEVRSPGSVRPWQHVLEPLSGYLQLAARMLESDDTRWLDGWNFGPVTGVEVPVAELVEQLIAAWGEGRWVDVSSASAPHEARVLRLSIDKAMVDLGWRPRWGTARALVHLARWYRRFYREGATDMRATCEADIAAYEQSAMVGEQAIEEAARV